MGRRGSGPVMLKSTDGRADWLVDLGSAIYLLILSKLHGSSINQISCL